MSKINKGNHAGKKAFMKSTGNKKLANFGTKVKNTPNIFRYIKDQAGVGGLMDAAEKAAGTAVGIVGSVAESIVSFFM